jgi:hypothetical protein
MGTVCSIFVFSDVDVAGTLWPHEYCVVLLCRPLSASCALRKTIWSYGLEIKRGMANIP